MEKADESSSSLYSCPPLPVLLLDSPTLIRLPPPRLLLRLLGSPSPSGDGQAGSLPFRGRYHKEGPALFSERSGEVGEEWEKERGLRPRELVGRLGEEGKKEVLDTGAEGGY
jgi:hypothetical protein